MKIFNVKYELREPATSGPRVGNAQFCGMSQVSVRLAFERDNPDMRVLKVTKTDG